MNFPHPLRHRAGRHVLLLFGVVDLLFRVCVGAKLQNIQCHPPGLVQQLAKGLRGKALELLTYAGDNPLKRGCLVALQCKVKGGQSFFVSSLERKFMERISW